MPERLSPKSTTASYQTRSGAVSSRAKQGICSFFGRYSIFLLAALFLTCSSLNGQNRPTRPKIYGIALVRLRVSDLERSRTFYHQNLGLYPLSAGCFSPVGIAYCYHLNSSQQLEIVPGPPPDNAVETIGFQVSDVSEMRNLLLANEIKCGTVTESNLGDKFIETHGPEGHRILFISLGSKATSLSAYPGDSHLIHTGFVVRDRAAMDHFYKDVLGFHLYWHGGRKDGETSWVAMQVPDGTDWVEYMLNVPADANKHTLGVMNHIALGVPDIHAAQKQLLTNGMKLTEEPKLGRDGKWQLNVYDPDETRVEFMEFTPTEKPCCSEFTGPHPKP
jgi:catechol 2,3-dioxygenase-like lactoylglutathione lyase family enzyme